MTNRWTYAGSKNHDGTWRKIINEMPPHRVYVELFLGTGAIFRRKRPAEINIGVELDESIIPRAQLEMPSLQIIRDDALKFLKTFQSTADTLIYADPPYLMETRRSQIQLYNFEFGDTGSHRELLDIANRSPAMWIISGYPSKFYDNILKSPRWRSEQFNSSTHAGKSVESIWMNFRSGAARHDYRFAGANKSERQAIKRKIERWIARIKSLPTNERGAILNALGIPQSEITAPPAE